VVTDDRWSANLLDPPFSSHNSFNLQISARFRCLESGTGVDEIDLYRYISIEWFTLQHKHHFVKSHLAYFLLHPTAFFLKECSCMEEIWTK